MSTPTHHWKLGLFVVLGVALALATTVFLGARSLAKNKAVTYMTYFDESVQGLEVGSPVKFRGVTLGNVSSIDIAADRRHVEIGMDLGVKDLVELGLAEGKGKDTKFRVPPELRVQLAQAGITGGKFLQIDFFVVADNPRPELPFPVPPNYIPAAVSTLKNLEDAIVKAVDRIPDIADGIGKILSKVDAFIDDLSSKKLPENLSKLLQETTDTWGALKATLAQLNAAKLSGRAHDVLVGLGDTITRANAAIARVDAVISRVGGDRGLVASALRATTAFGDVALNARTVGPEMETTLRDIQGAATAIRRLADALERDPDMLLKGRGKPR